MTTSKRWTYGQITHDAEEQIRRLMQQGLAAEDHSTYHICRCMAMGAQALWSKITMGWQHDGDGGRLQAIIDQPWQEPANRS
jgi:hypothetical protein